MIGKDMIFQTICAVFRDKVIDVIYDDCKEATGRVKIAARIFHIATHEIIEEQ